MAVSALLFLGGCVQPYYGPPVNSYARGPTLATQDQTAGIEEQDRINRFRRLANMQGITAPAVEQLMLPPGSVDFMSGAVPVVRVVFPERAFFAFNMATPLPSAGPIFDVIAENMKHDVPDAALTVLGHTDAIGTDAYNIDLSRHRAEAVMEELVARGVNRAQLSEVAIGKRQPIAPNDTAEGRALNRRVEFMISPALSANLAAIQQRVVSASYIKTDSVQQLTTSDEPVGLASVAQVYRLNPTQVPASQSPTETVSTARPEADNSRLSTMGGLNLSPPSTQPLSTQSVASVQLAPTMPVAPVHLIPPSEVTPLSLGTNPTPY
jgi:outer membrane protein OmpA-like peptidoglycan-associated protein